MAGLRAKIEKLQKEKAKVIRAQEEAILAEEEELAAPLSGILSTPERLDQAARNAELNKARTVPPDSPILRPKRPSLSPSGSPEESGKSALETAQEEDLAQYVERQKPSAQHEARMRALKEVADAKLGRLREIQVQEAQRKAASEASARATQQERSQMAKEDVYSSRESTVRNIRAKTVDRPIASAPVHTEHAFEDVQLTPRPRAVSTIERVPPLTPPAPRLATPSLRLPAVATSTRVAGEGVLGALDAFNALPVIPEIGTAIAILDASNDVQQLQDNLTSLAKDHVWAGNLLAAGRDTWQLAMTPYLSFLLIPYSLYRFGSAAVNIAKGLRDGEGPIDIPIRPRDLNPANLLNRAVSYLQVEPPASFHSTPQGQQRPGTVHLPRYVGSNSLHAINQDDQAVIDAVEAHETPAERKVRLELVAERNKEAQKDGEDLLEKARDFQATRAAGGGPPLAITKIPTSRPWRHPKTGQTWEEWLATREKYVA